MLKYFLIGLISLCTVAQAQELENIERLNDAVLESTVADWQRIAADSRLGNCKGLVERVQVLNRTPEIHLDTIVSGILSALEPGERMKYSRGIIMPVEASEEAIVRSLSRLAPEEQTDLRAELAALAARLVPVVDAGRVAVRTGTAFYAVLKEGQQEIVVAMVDYSVRVFYDQQTDQALVVAIGQCESP